jgi:hypothetical protein
MKKYILTLFLLGSLNAFAQTAKVKIVLYPNSDEEYSRCIKLANDSTFDKDFCFEVIRKKKDANFPGNYGVVKVDFFSCDDNILLGVCQANTIPTKRDLVVFGNNALTIANDPKLKKSTKVFY